MLAYAPDWARRGGEIDATAYARFAAAAVRRYAPRGVLHYELWNEPNIAGFWRNGPRPDPANYTRLVRAAYPAMKAEEPDAVVLAGALAPGGSARSACSSGALKIAPVRFLEAMYEEGAAGSFDAVSFHPYTPEPASAHPCNPWFQIAGGDSSLRSVMEANGDGEKAIWLTEFGARADLVGEERQAEIIRTAIELWHEDALAGPLFVYTYRDPENDTFNLVRDDWSRRPAWDAFQAAVADH